MFCSKCGTQQSNSSATFCPSCGSPFNAAQSAGTPAPGFNSPSDPFSAPSFTPNAFGNPEPAPKKNGSSIRIIGIALAGVAAVAVGAAIFMANSFRLDAASAEARMMTASDFAFDFSPMEDENDIAEVKYPIFAASDDCTQDTDMAELIDSSTVLASADWDNNITSDSPSYFHQDIVEFKDVNEAGRFLELVREGYANADCAYNSTSDSSIFTALNSGLTTASSEYGVDGDESVVFEHTFSIYAFSLGFGFGQEGKEVIVRKGKYVLVIDASADDDDPEVTRADLASATQDAIRKFLD